MANTATYEEIAKSQKAIEDNFAIIKKGFQEAEKKILERRTTVIAAIQKEQAIEASRLAEIGNLIKSFIVPEQP